MRKIVPASRLVSVICKSWAEGLSITYLPELLGVSRPTFYKLTRRFREEGLEVKLVPNMEALGYTAYLVKTVNRTVNGRVYAIDLKSMAKASIMYVSRAYTILLDDLAKILGSEADGPFKVSSVICPTGEVFKVQNSRASRPDREELKVILAVSESFLGIKEASQRLGLNWQRVASAVRNARGKGLLVGPVVYWRPSKTLDRLGFILEVNGTPSRGLIRGLLSGSSLVLMEGEKTHTDLVIGVAPPGVLINALDAYSEEVSRVYLAPDFPLQALGNNLNLNEATPFPATPTMPRRAGDPED